MRKIEHAHKASGSDDDTAWFTSALAVAWPHGPVVAVEGQVHGRLVFPGRGVNGFGYDPIFVADGDSLTFGELAPAAKDAISHRARAFEKLKAAIF
jgi:XTP/dITP diphosphohydrolase